MDDAYTFGAWLKQRRKWLRLTQRELAESVGYAEVTLRKVEADELRPSVEMAQRLAAAVQVPAAEQSQFVRFARDETGTAPAIDPNAQPLCPRTCAPSIPHGSNSSLPRPRSTGARRRMSAGSRDVSPK